MKAFFITLTLAILFFVALLFGATNEQTVNISYFIAQGEFRLPVVLASVFLLGFGLSWIAAFFHLLGTKMTARKQRKQIQKLEQQLAEYKVQLAAIPQAREIAEETLKLKDTTH